MLDERVTQFVQEAVRIRVREFDHDLAMRLLQADTDAVRAGQMGGSGRTNRYAVEYRQELRNRAQYVFLEIQRALGLYPQSFDGTLKNFLIGFHVTEVRRQCSDLQSMLDKRLGGSTAFGSSSLGALQGQLNDECSHLREKYTLEIGAFVQAALLRSNAAPEGNSVVIHGPVGVVQTGAYASAVVPINVGANDRDAMAKALDLVSTTLRDSQQLAHEHRRQILAVVQEAKIATQHQSPNPSLLRGMFTVICETLQTLAATEPAMAAMRAAALPFGIAL